MDDILLALAAVMQGSDFVEMVKQTGLTAQVLTSMAFLLDSVATSLLTGLAAGCLLAGARCSSEDGRQRTRLLFFLSSAGAVMALLALYAGLAGIKPHYLVARPGSQWIMRGFLCGLAATAVLCCMKGRRLAARPGLRIFLYILALAAGFSTLFFCVGRYPESIKELRVVAEQIRTMNRTDAARSLENNAVYAALIAEAPLHDMEAMEKRYGFRAGGTFSIDAPFLLVKVNADNYIAHENEPSSPVLHNPNMYGNVDAGLRVSRTLVLAYAHTVDSKRNRVQERTGNISSEYIQTVGRNVVHIYYYDPAGRFVGGETLADGPLRQSGDYPLAPWVRSSVATRVQHIQDAVQKRLR